MTRYEGKNMHDLVDHLKRDGVIKSKRVEDAMLSVDRGKYSKVKPYVDGPQSIGFGVTISAPHMHAHALEILKDHLCEECNALDIGSGTGYLTACMSSMIGDTGTVVGIDIIPQLIDQAIDVIKEDHPGLIESGRIQFVEGDGRKGFEKEAPYDAIHVGAAVPKIPKELMDQLKKGGRMIIPVGPLGETQVYMQVDKLSNGNIKETPLLNVLYGSLTDKKSLTDS